MSKILNLPTKNKEFKLDFASLPRKMKQLTLMLTDHLLQVPVIKTDKGKQQEPADVCLKRLTDYENCWPLFLC